MIVRRIILAAAFAAIALPAPAGQAITVGYRDVVTPDPELLDFVQQIRRAWISVKRVDPSARDRFFAPRVKTFMKTETPFKPFEPRGDITSDYLLNAVFIMRSRKGSISEADLPDQAQGALSEIGRQLIHDPVWGKLPEVPDMICAGAAFDVDSRAVAKFSRMHGVRIDALVFSRQAIALHTATNTTSEHAGDVPPYTLMAIARDEIATQDWRPMVASNGIRGYMVDTIPLEILAQKHVCFARVDGAYRISALFGYGL
jgi:hypothetical protein